MHVDDPRTLREGDGTERGAVAIAAEVAPRGILVERVDADAVGRAQPVHALEERRITRRMDDERLRLVLVDEVLRVEEAVEALELTFCGSPPSRGGC